MTFIGITFRYIDSAYYALAVRLDEVDLVEEKLPQHLQREVELQLMTTFDAVGLHDLGRDLPVDDLQREKINTITKIGTHNL